MAKLMARLGVFLVLLLFVVAKEAILAKRVKCTDSKYPDCIANGYYGCPSGCPQTCTMNCEPCAQLCPRTPPPPASPLPPKKSPSNAAQEVTPAIQEIPPPSPPKKLLPPKKSAPPPKPPYYSPLPPPPPPPSGEIRDRRVWCKNNEYPHCYRLEFTCPASCPTQCEVDRVTCSPVCICDQPGGVCQETRFIGGDGITFYFHGKKDRDFCLVSDSTIHINAHFIGRRNQDKKRDFTWVQSLGILFDTHRLFISATKMSIWDNSVDRLFIAFDGRSVYLREAKGAKWHSESLPDVSIIEAKGNFKIKAIVVPITKKDSFIHNYGITQDDCYAHLHLSFKFYSLLADVSGVLGQTYAKNYVSRVKMGATMPVLGGEREFASSGLFAADCATTRFHWQAEPEQLDRESRVRDLNCAGGGDDRGVVCKR